MMRLLSNMDRTVNQKLAALDQSLNVLNLKMSSLDLRLAGLETQSQNFFTLQQRLTLLDQRITALGQRVASVGDSMTQLLHSDNWNASTCKSSGHLKPAMSPTPHVTSTSPTVDSKFKPADFQIQQIRKKETLKAYIVRIDYRSSRKPESILITTADGLAPRRVGRQKRGRVRVKLLKSAPVNGDFNPTIMIVFPDTFYILQLKLNGTPDVMQGPHITLCSPQGSDVTYKAGTPMTIDLVFKVQGVERETLQGLTSVFKLFVKSTTQEYSVIRYASWFQSDSSNPIVVVNSTGSVSNRRFSLQVQPLDTEGVLQYNIGASFNCSYNCLLSHFSVTRTLQFFSQLHLSPFPEDFLGFVQDDFREGDDSTFYCSLHQGPSEQCIVFCEALASRQTPVVRISRVDSPDNALDMPVVDASWSRLGSAILAFDDVTFYHAGEYECEARVPGKKISKTMTLVVRELARIDRDRSKAVKIENGSLLVTCVAQGFPRPDIAFDMTSLRNLTSHHYVIRKNGVDSRTLKAELLVMDRGMLARDSVTSFLCLALLPDGSQQLDFHRILIPPAIE